METPETQITIDKLTVGSRLIVRSRTDWRFAAVSRVTEDRVVLTVCSPRGGTYRLRREFNTIVETDGEFLILPYDCSDSWRDNFSIYDIRW